MENKSGAGHGKPPSPFRRGDERDGRRHLPAAITQPPPSSRRPCAPPRGAAPAARLVAERSQWVRAWLGAMRAAVWTARSALLYSVGGWTLLGALLHHTQTGGGGGGGPEKESDPEASQTTRREVITTNTPIGLQITTVVTYNETAETPLARLCQRLKSFLESHDGGPSKN
ncbi:small integral membrane protein 26 [Struthio camelus]|uniref:small integral membrane protein 26 n=1 Tax=Struthio camelus TaxID=8801 RepID=UPI003603FCDE